jgi:hypothetical protein
MTLQELPSERSRRKPCCKLQSERWGCHNRKTVINNPEGINTMAQFFKVEHKPAKFSDSVDLND